MRELLLALPIAAFAGTWVALLGVAARQGRADWRDAFLHACVVWGALAAVRAEVLSPFGAVRQGWLGAHCRLCRARGGLAAGGDPRGVPVAPPIPPLRVIQ